jgi:hypothetical protein
MTTPDEPLGTSFSSGCGVGAVPARVDIYLPGRPSTTQYFVEGNFPSELREDFPDGGIVRFTRDGDSVVVTEAKNPAPTGEPS